VRSAAGLALAALLTGCSSSQGANVDDFIGVWMGDGLVTTKCGASPGKSAPFAETITITKGTDAPLLVVVGSCSLQMNGQGDVATLRPGQTCAVMRDGVMTNATYSSGDFTVVGIKATFALKADFTSAGPNGGLASCSYVASGEASKLQK
jgi:hypothetical protein